MANNHNDGPNRSIQDTSKPTKLTQLFFKHNGISDEEIFKAIVSGKDFLLVDSPVTAASKQKKM